MAEMTIKLRGEWRDGVFYVLLPRQSGDVVVGAMVPDPYEPGAMIALKPPPYFTWQVTRCARR